MLIKGGPANSGRKRGLKPQRLEEWRCSCGKTNPPYLVRCSCRERRPD